MSEAKHTPGPWFVDPNDPFYVLELDGRPVATASFRHTPVLNLVDETKANARLIAAAPELLEALKHCRAVFPQDSWADDVKKMIDAAIAKTEGKEGA